MKVLNLANKETSDIKFGVSSFPDGQQDIVIDASSLDGYRYCKIYSRFDNARDFELILCATKALKRLGVKIIHLYIPYLLGARSDRQFQEGGTSYLVDIVAPILNAQQYESVSVLDVHSDVAAACINNLKTIDNTEVVAWALSQIYSAGTSYSTSNYFLVSPDGGSLKKIYKVAESIGYNAEVITCSKSRDTDGKLSKVKVPMQNFEGKDLIIIDDICDGGRTFINIAKEIRKFPEEAKVGKIYLIVTHGIFTAGFEELYQCFETIYTTNSYKQFNPEETFGREETLEKIGNFIKQLNVF